MSDPRLKPLLDAVVAQDIAEAAVAWVRARDDAAFHRELRNQHNLRGHALRGSHGWTHACFVENPDGSELPLDRWCEHCRAGHSEHALYRAAARLAGTRLRRLRRLVRTLHPAEDRTP